MKERSEDVGRRWGRRRKRERRREEEEGKREKRYDNAKKIKRNELKGKYEIDRKDKRDRKEGDRERMKKGQIMLE